MKTKFLWIEDNATADLKHLLMPVYSSGEFDPAIALNVTDGLQRIFQAEFEAVIVDIRMLPGSQQRWIDLYNQWGKNKAAARLGLQLLRGLLGPAGSPYRLERIPSWVSAEKFGVLTVESRADLQQDLKTLNISVYEQKTARTPNTVLIDMVRRITSAPLKR